MKATLKFTALMSVIIGLTIGLLTAVSQGADWGDFTATFKLDGKAPAPKPLDANKDQAVCGKQKLLDESLVVSDEGGIANVVVYLFVKTGGAKPAIHDDYKKTEKAEVRLDNKDCRFEPHIQFVRTTQKLLIGNKDAVGHNTKIDTLVNSPVNPIIPANGELPQQFKAEEKLPTTVSCSIHPWMTARVVIKEHPYVGISDKDGKISIKNLPAGDVTFQVWHEVPGFVQDVKIDGKDTKWAKGRVDVKIKSGANDLGEVKVGLKVFEKK